MTRVTIDVRDSGDPILKKSLLSLKLDERVSVFINGVLYPLLIASKGLTINDFLIKLRRIECTHSTLFNSVINMTSFMDSPLNDK